MKQTSDAVHAGTGSCQASEQCGVSDMRWSKCSSMGLALLGITWVGSHVQAAPEGGQVVAGSANIVQSQVNHLDVVQQSERAAINWQSFSIGTSEHVNFQQPSNQSATLNRVTGADLSSIQGRMTANGNVFLVNPNGILFGKNAKIDVGGLVASTANISDQDFMAGHYSFKEPSKRASMIVNEGEINVAEGGLVALVAPGVENSGTITARLGRVVLASGDAFTLDLYGDELVSLAVDDSVLEGLTDSQGNAVAALVNQTGTIQAEGGEVLLTAAHAQAAVDKVINMSGIIRTQSVAQKNGEIVLYGGAEGKVQVSGVLDASGRGVGQSGGNVKVLGDEVALLAGAQVDVSGDVGGGTALMGGDYQGKGATPRATRTVVERGASIAADALRSGNGGKAIVWSDGTTDYQGYISAKGGADAGDGGFIEVSGKKDLLFGGDVDLTAAHGAGGTLLLDPENITVAETGSDTLTGDPSTIKASTISNILGNGTNVLLNATNSIDIFATIDARFADAPPGGGLSLLAGNDILIGANILTKNGPISMNAGDSISMALGTMLFADNSPIGLTAGGLLSVQHLVTTGDVSLSSTAGSVSLGQNLGGFEDSKFRLGRLSITANQGMVSLQGLQTTGDVEVAALRNIDVNGPIESGGNVTLTSQGTNDDKTAINLKHNIYTLGGDITFGGEVLLNPTAAELVVEFPIDGPPGTADPIDLTDSSAGLFTTAETKAASEFALRLCPTCEVQVDEVLGFVGVVPKKESDGMRFAQIDVFDTDGNLIVKRLDKNDTLADAEKRVAALAKLFELRQVTVDSRGGDIVFAGEVRRETFNGFENFKKAFPVTDLTSLDGLTPGTGQLVQAPRRSPPFFEVDFRRVVFTDSFIHHGLALSAGGDNTSGNIVFKGTVGNKRDLIVTLSNQAVNDPIGDISDVNGAVVEGAAQFPPALGSFRLSIESANTVNFEKDLFLNDLEVRGTEIRDLSNLPPGIIVSGDGSLGSRRYLYQTPGTQWGSSTNQPRPVGFSGITGLVIPGELPVRPGGGSGVGGPGGGAGGGGVGGGGSPGAGGPDVGVVADVRTVLSPVKAPFRERDEEERCARGVVQKAAPQDGGVEDVLKQGQKVIDAIEEAGEAYGC